MIGPHRKVGRPSIHGEMMAKYGISKRRVILSKRIKEQLALCKSEEARRLLLGASK